MSRPTEPVPSFQKRQRRARVERKRLVGWLRKKGKTIEARALAEKLESCRLEKRCGSGACPTCMVLNQEKFARGLKELIRERTIGRTVFTLTIATKKEAAPRGALHSFDAVNHRRRLRRVLSPLPITWAAGGLDVSLNEHKEGRYPGFWLPHVYLIGVTADIHRLRKQLRDLMPSTEIAPRPVKLQLWDGRKNALLYALKSHFVRRIGTDEATRHVRKTGMSRTCRATLKDKLRSAERLELFLFLDELGPMTRLYSVHCQVHPGRRKYTIWNVP